MRRVPRCDHTQYNAHGELERQTVVNTQTEAVLFDVIYDSALALPAALGKRDALGRILKKTETVDGVTRVFEYGYNAAGRPWLETVRVDGTLVSQYQYDGNGNRTNVQLDRSYAGGGSVSLSGSDIVTDNEDRLTKYGDLTLVYDPLGRVIEKRNTSVTPNAVTKYTWDSLGALRKVELPDGRVIEYIIDAIGRRVGKMVNGVVQRRWIYRDTLRPIAELNAAGDVVARFVYADGVGAEDQAIEAILTRVGAGLSNGLGRMTPEFVITANGAFRVITDHLDSVRLVVMIATGEVVISRGYEEFGLLLAEIGPELGSELLPFGFAGGIYDADSELVRFGAREYDPRAGRWLSADPILFEGAQFNLHAYVDNDPINETDPDGTGPKEIAQCLWNGYSIADCLDFERKLLCRRLGWFCDDDQPPEARGPIFPQRPKPIPLGECREDGRVVDDCFNDPDTGQCRSMQGRCMRTGGFCPKNARGAACRCMR